MAAGQAFWTAGTNGVRVQGLELHGQLEHTTNGFFFYGSGGQGVLMCDLAIQDFGIGVYSYWNLTGSTGGASRQNIHLVGSTVQNNLHHGFFGSSANSQILGNTFSHNGSDALLDHNIYMDSLEDTANTGIVVKGNTFVGSGGSSADEQGTGYCDTTQLVAHGNMPGMTIEGNTLAETQGTALPGCWGVEADTEGSPTEREVFDGLVVRGNIFRYVGNASIVVSNANGFTIENNLIVGSPSMNSDCIDLGQRTAPNGSDIGSGKIRNNTIYATQNYTTGIHFERAGNGGHEVYNNALYVAGTGNTCESNLGVTFDSNNLCATTANSTWFTSAGTDFTPKSGGPLVAAGYNTAPHLAPTTDITGTTRPTPPSIGAYDDSLPTISSFGISSSTITIGSWATLSWTTTGATSLSLDQNIGTVTGLTSTTTAPDSSKVYTLTATNAQGSVTSTVGVTVVAAPQIISFTAASSTITNGSSTILAWTTSGATALSINQGVGTMTGNTSTIVSPTVTTTYTLTATNAAGTAVTSSLVVAVTGPGSLPTIGNFSVSSSTITSGNSTILSWTTSGATTLFIDQGVGTVTGQTSTPTSPTSTRAYTLTATNAQGSVTSTVSVTVIAATPTFSPSAGSYSGTQTVTISTASSGCGSYIYWNTTGNPSSGDTHGTSVSVVTTSTVYAKVIGCPGHADSAVGSAAYTIGPAAGVSLLPGFPVGFTNVGASETFIISPTLPSVTGPALLWADLGTPWTATAVTSVTDTAGLTWQRGPAVYGTISTAVESWYAFVPSGQTVTAGDVVTWNLNNFTAGNAHDVVVSAFSGAKQSGTPWGVTATKAEAYGNNGRESLISVLGSSTSSYIMYASRAGESGNTSTPYTGNTELLLQNGELAIGHYSTVFAAGDSIQTGVTWVANAFVIGLGVEIVTGP